MSVEAKLRARIAKGTLQEDPAQIDAAKALDRLLRHLEVRPDSRFMLRVFRRPETIKGLYLWGGVGRGKSISCACLAEAR